MADPQSMSDGARAADGASSLDHGHDARRNSATCRACARIVHASTGNVDAPSFRTTCRVGPRPLFAEAAREPRAFDLIADVSLLTGLIGRDFVLFEQGIVATLNDVAHPNS